MMTIMHGESMLIAKRAAPSLIVMLSRSPHVGTGGARSGLVVSAFTRANCSRDYHADRIDNCQQK